MNFDFENASVFRAVKIEKLPLFRYAKILKNIFLALFLFAFFLLIISFLDLSSGYSAARLFVFSLVFYLIFWNLYLFSELKIKESAEFLSFSAAKIVSSSINFCKKRKLAVNSTALLYFCLKMSKDINLVSFRLGLDPKKIEADTKNCLEKSERQTGPEIFSKDFVKTLEEAQSISKILGNNVISEGEIFAALAGRNELFKKILMDFDLKKEDVENLTFWLSSARNSFERSRKFWSYENLARRGSFGKDWASGYTIVLDQFSTDWRKIVSKWAFREIVGHKKEIEQVEMILAKSNLANALIVGEQGTGRKSIVEALAQKCYLGQSLPELNNKRVVELDLVSLVSRIQNEEKLEAALDQIFSEVVASGNVILAIDELQNFVGQKEHKPGQVDISGILSKYLAIPSFQFIAITDYAGLHKNIEEVPSFADFFRKVEVSEVTESDTIKILQTQALEFEHKNKILILYPSIREIVNLTARYMPSLPFPKKALDILDEAVVYVQSLKERVVLPHHVAEIISKKTEIPVGKMEAKEKETLLNLEALIHQRIVNQEQAVKEISIAMRRARAGIASKTRPMGSFLFLGPTGVGKTETSKALAQIYFGNETKMIRLDMSEFQSVADIGRLIGAQSPVEMQGLLTTPVRETPFSLVLIDEIEKSYPDILNLFLQILDEGHITDGQGRKVVFTNTIIICTSNAAADIIFKQVEFGKKIDKQKLLDVLIEKNIFKPEFINRFDAVVIFNPLTKENLLDIAQLSLQTLQKNLKEKEIDFEITESLKEKIVELSYKPEFGAREMRRVIQDNVESVIAQALISEKIKKGDTIQINPENFELIINLIT